MMRRRARRPLAGRNAGQAVVVVRARGLAHGSSTVSASDEYQVAALARALHVEPRPQLSLQLEVHDVAPIPALDTEERTHSRTSVFTILGGTTIPDRAAIVREHCFEGSRVELRREAGSTNRSPRISVWLQCRSLLGLMKAWKRIGEVPAETAVTLLELVGKSPTVVGYGTVKAVYAPVDREEAVVTVDIEPRFSRDLALGDTGPARRTDSRS